MKPAPAALTISSMGYLRGGISHAIPGQTRVWLAASHGGGPVVQYHHCEVVLVVNGIYQGRYSRVEECGIPYEAHHFLFGGLGKAAARSNGRTHGEEVVTSLVVVPQFPRV